MYAWKIIAPQTPLLSAIHELFNPFMPGILLYIVVSGPTMPLKITEQLSLIFYKIFKMEL